MKFKFYTIFSLALLFIGFTSCDDDINIDPNRPSEVPTNSLMTTSQKMLTSSLRSENISLRGSMLFSQYFSQNTYTSQSRYEIPFGYSDNYWSGMYSALSNLEEIIYLNSDPLFREREIVTRGGRNQNQIAVSRILKTYIFAALTDVFGNIPYQSYGNPDPEFEALQRDPENVVPRYASQEKIYRDMLNELKAAGDTLSKYSNESTLASGDIIYGGSNAKWAKFANSLRLRLATRLKKHDDALYRSHFNDALAKGVFAGNADNAAFRYSTKAPNEAPLYRATVTNNRTDFAISEGFIAVLKGDNPQFPVADPRLEVYAAPSASEGLYVGLPYGLTEAQAGRFKAKDVSLPSSIVGAADYAEVLMEYSEVAFLISEYKGWSQPEYEAGVRASLEKWKIASAAADVYISGLLPANERNVLNQKYVALFMQGLESWSEYRRTGYPNFLVGKGDIIFQSNTDSFVFKPLFGDGGIPSRLYYPIKEQSVNKANYQQAIAAQGYDRIETRLWVFK